jgi:hypothetical protein
VAIIEEFQEIAAVLVGQGSQPPVIHLCASEHNSIYVECTVMWSRGLNVPSSRRRLGNLST